MVVVCHIPVTRVTRTPNNHILYITWQRQKIEKESGKQSSGQTVSVFANQPALQKVQPGPISDVLMYARPWEKESDPAAKVNLTVKVN